MPTVVVIHRPKRGQKVCNYPLAKIRIAEKEQAHEGAWTYQRRYLAPLTAPPCGGCGLRVGNAIGFYFKNEEPAPVVATKTGPVRLETLDAS